MKSTNMKALSVDEKMVMDAIRARKFQNINIHVNDGKVVLIRTAETIKPKPKQKTEKQSLI